MKRKLFNSEIAQKSKNSYLSASDLIKAGNIWRLTNGKELFNLNEWLRQKKTKEFIEALENMYGEVKISSKGKNLHTWFHPYLFIDLALSINPELKIKVYSWIYDNLIEYRNNSGDSYKKMAGALWIAQKNKSNFKIDIVSVANRIKVECDVKDWQTASEKQLKLRDKIQEYISLFSDIIRDRQNLIEVSIKKAREVTE